ncbi:hypothetical protein FOCC_FOCC014555 [Frankliniella occidentalis]|nr:hypothetical protein FOCC_FOCC014555 [Frankliniella occidentalis]
MDELREEFLRLFDCTLQLIVDEQDLLAEILLDDDEDNWEADALQVQAAVADNDLIGLAHLLEAVVGGVFIQELMEMVDDDYEDELMYQLIYGRNDRQIDWRANLPNMEYLRTLEDPYFLKHFRMDRETFENLIVVIGNHLVENNLLIRLRTEIDKCLLMVLWILSNMDTYRATGVVFKVSPGTVHFHYIVVIEALRKLATRYIKWPLQEDRNRIKRAMEQRSQYPGVVGFIDGTLIRISAPAVQKERYFDRHHSYSLNVQAVCDHNLLFRDVYMGEPESVHDSRVFERSPLHDIFLERQDVISDNEHILGDGGYECTKKLLTPFRDNGNLTMRQRRFNYVHSSIRMHIERAFGRLKGKYRRLIKLYTKRYDGICIMQPDQFAAERGGDMEENDSLEEDEDAIRDGPVRCPRFEHPLLAQSKVAGARKRELIADQLLDHFNEQL